MGDVTILDGRVTILAGDVLDRLRGLPDNSVDCVVTSPPYWGLRSYLPPDDPLKPLEIGLEPTLGEHLDVMVRVFEEVRRVLKPTGTLWLNYGDCYASEPNGRSAADTAAAGNDDRTFRDKPFSTVGPIYDPDGGQKGGGARGENKGNKHSPAGRVVSGGTLKPKDLCMVPNRLAIALQDAGWWVRSEIVWAKPNPMPSSVTDRPATAHEKIWLLTKSARYWYDATAVRVDRKTPADTKMPDGWDTGLGAHGTIHRAGREKGAKLTKQQQHPNRQVASLNENWIERHGDGSGAWPRGTGRHLRNYEPAPLEVWEIATAPFSGSHFATFPPALAARAMRAGCPERVCAVCGRPWERLIETTYENPGNRTTNGSRSIERRHETPGFPVRLESSVKTLGFAPACEHVEAPTVPGVVLDPFGGAGTVGMVAARMGRRAILIELNPESVELARVRIEKDWASSSHKGRHSPQDAVTALPLFAPAEPAPAPAVGPGKPLGDEHGAEITSALVEQPAEQPAVAVLPLIEPDIDPITGESLET